ncbi:MAG: hypothetical protein COU22_00425, partial [Candidatus Komeilibacteria bacterium CG10_big_fil_rev_8_21_14_0_10_41_13]
MPKAKDIKKNNTSEISETKISASSKAKTLEEIYEDRFMPIRPTRSKGSIGLLIASLIISMLGGFVGGFVNQSFFQTSYVYQPSEVNEPAENGKKEVLDLNFLLKEDDESYNKIFSEIRKQIVGFYLKKEQPGILDSVYTEKEFLGSGVVVASDGWLLTHQSVVGDQDYVIITSDKKILEPQQEIVDSFSHNILIKVESSDLSPIKFASLNSLSPTDFLLTARYSIQNHGSDIVKTSVQKFAYHDQQTPSDFLLSTERQDHYLKAARQFEPVYNGAALINKNNEIVGLLFDSGRSFINLATPSYYLKSAVNNFLVNSSEVVRASLGVNYLDLSEIAGLPDSVTEGQAKGAVLLGDSAQNILAVLADSAAEEAGLKAGDIILKVNNEDVDE